MPESSIASFAASKISVNYFAEVFHATGYGEAARSYIYAFRTADIEVHVTNINPKDHHVSDDLIATLLSHDSNADFDILHCIPSRWASIAHRLDKTIAVTVWEADRIPVPWRRQLNRAIDTWVPSKFNAVVFSRQLATPTYRLPYPVPVGLAAGTVPPSVDVNLGIGSGEFVFYSIFEWQDRKNPLGLIEAFLRAFPDECGAVLVIKTDARSAHDAKQALERLRAVTDSHARVVLHCSLFNPTLIEALHARGDCYVSLHRGEGWGYPLFEAALRGKPVIATAYGGPLDYLDSRHHWLVRNTAVTISKPYFYFREPMRWGEPDLNHAQQGLCWVYQHRDEAREAAKHAAARLRGTYSLQNVGMMAKLRLLQLIADQIGVKNPSRPA
jgi:glycosyltransferase involved in cell wall biosynthesis